MPKKIGKYLREKKKDKKCRAERKKVKVTQENRINRKKEKKKDRVMNKDHLK